MDGDVGPFQRIFGRQDVSGQLRGLVVDDLRGGEDLEVLQGRDQLARLGEAVTKLPPTLIRARMLSRRDLVGQHGTRPFVDERLRLRAAARAGTERSLDRCDRQQLAESL